MNFNIKMREIFVLVFSLISYFESIQAMEIDHVQNYHEKKIGKGSVILFSLREIINIDYFPSDIFYYILDIYASFDYHLDLQASKITDKNLPQFMTKYITSLNLDFNNKITDEGIKNFSQITNLSLIGRKNKITDEGIKRFTSLTTLNLSFNNKISTKGIKDFTNLTHLNLSNNAMITNEIITKLTNLSHLNLEFNKTITDAGIMYLVNLNDLILLNNNTITDVGTQYLSKLQNTLKK